MKTLSLAAIGALILALAACAPKPAQQLSGQWQGLLSSAGRNYRTVLVVEGTGSKPRITYSSLDSDIVNQRAENVAFDGKSLSLTLPGNGGLLQAAHS
jgi:hypothetical protein